MKKILSMLIVMLMIGNLLPMAIFAADEAPMEMVASISAENTITLQVRTTDTFEWYTLEFTLNLPEGCTIATISKGANYDEIGGGNFTTNKTTGIISVMGAGGEVNENASAGKEIVTVTVDTTNAVGDELSFGATVIAADIDGNKFDWSSATVTSNTLNLSDGTPGGETPTIPTDKAYTADLDTNYEKVKVGDTITVDVLVGGTTGEFASSELELSYTGLTFDSDNSTANGADITAENGAIKIIDHGETTTWTEGTVTAYTLAFTVDSLNGAASGSANVKLTGAALSTAADAKANDLTPATITINTEEFAVTPADLNVTLDDGLTGNTTIEYNKGSITIEAEDKNYDYTLSVSNGTLTPVDGQDGKWILTGVTENVTVSITKQDPKTYTITFNTLDHIQNAENLGAVNNVVNFTYDPNGSFSFILKDDVDATTTDGVVYKVEYIKYGDETGESVEHTVSTGTTNRTYTISGANITDDIVIKTSSQTVTADQFTVTVPTEYANELKANPTIVEKDESTTLKLTPEAGYKYTIKYTMGTNEEVTLATGANAEATYTIEDITANVTVTITKEFDETSVTVTVSEYLALDNSQSIYMVTVIGDLQYTYNGNVMYHSAEYNNAQGAYIYLIIDAAGADTVALVSQARAVIGLTEEIPTEIDYTGDVNMTNGKIDANDAQLVWNIYNDKLYSDFDALSMEKFLRADVDGNGEVEMNDASTIIGFIKNAN